ncbi:MAG: CinA family protein, partial [Eubacterium sp.]|nr:CinA family protein [Eubacterium sp.]
ETALSMASACRERIGTDIGIGVTGSIGTTDPNNADSVPGEVYAAIETDGTSSAERIELPDLSRWESRFFIADKLADMIRRVTIHG